jgi:hypothetical protein
VAFGYCSNVSNVIIGNSVKNIGAGAFRSCVSLTNVTIGNSVTIISGAALQGCTSLTGVTIPDGVASIGPSTFGGCVSLAEITIPSSVTSIGVLAFGGCSSLSAITVDSSNSVYSSLDGVLFNKSQTTLIRCPETKVGMYTVPAGVTAIFAQAFSACSSLTNIILGASVASVGSQAFDSCTSLTSFTIPNSVTNIGNLAFYLCGNLTGAFFQGNAPSVGGNVFYNANSATIYYLPGTLGWSSTFAGRPTALWYLPNPLILTGPNFGIQTGTFGFRVSWATNVPVVVEACDALASPVWVPLATNALAPAGWFQFSDSEWMNYPTRLYRVRSL